MQSRTSHLEMEEDMVVYMDGRIRTMVVDALGSKGSGCIKERAFTCKYLQKRVKEDNCIDIEDGVGCLGIHFATRGGTSRCLSQ
jgi:hypothetical protein